MLDYKESLDFLRSEWLPANPAAWPVSWRKNWKFRPGAAEDAPASGARAGQIPTQVVSAVANGFVLATARVFGGEGTTGESNASDDAEDEHHGISQEGQRVLRVLDKHLELPADDDAGDPACIANQDTNVGQDAGDGDDEYSFICTPVKHGASSNQNPVGAHFRNPYFLMVDDKLPMARLVKYHARYLLFTGPSFRPCLPQVPTNS
jgi:hypothetical protein